jgi:hypothetical protein
MKKEYKNNGTEEIKCPICGKGFAHFSLAVKKGTEFYHLKCITLNEKLKPYLAKLQTLLNN